MTVRCQRCTKLQA